MLGHNLVVDGWCIFMSWKLSITNINLHRMPITANEEPLHYQPMEIFSTNAWFERFPPLPALVKLSTLSSGASGLEQRNTSCVDSTGAIIAQCLNFIPRQTRILFFPNLSHLADTHLLLLHKHFHTFCSPTFLITLPPNLRTTTLYYTIQRHTLLYALRSIQWRFLRFLDSWFIVMIPTIHLLVPFQCAIGANRKLMLMLTHRK